MGALWVGSAEQMLMGAPWATQCDRHEEETHTPRARQNLLHLEVLVVAGLLVLLDLTLVPGHHPLLCHPLDPWADHPWSPSGQMHLCGMAGKNQSHHCHHPASAPPSCSPPQCLKLVSSQQPELMHRSFLDVTCRHPGSNTARPLQHLYKQFPYLL